MKREVIYQSKMNVRSESSIAAHFERAKKYLFYYAKIGVWTSIAEIPSTIVAEFFKLWEEQTIVNGKQIEINEFDDHYRIVKVKQKRIKS